MTSLRKAPHPQTIKVRLMSAEQSCSSPEPHSFAIRISGDLGVHYKRRLYRHEPTHEAKRLAHESNAQFTSGSMALLKYAAKATPSPLPASTKTGVNPKRPSFQTSAWTLRFNGHWKNRRNALPLKGSATESPSEKRSAFALRLAPSQDTGHF